MAVEKTETGTERGRCWEKVPPGSSCQASGDWDAQSPTAAAGKRGPGPGGLWMDSSFTDVLRTTALRSEKARKTGVSQGAVPYVYWV